ncbi:hypothetical protein [Devosia sp. SL43]|uniref:hypothetical protein n=1 Tax=Devosia sp. SL43 TaxID=2806348 RepID=UPI003FA40C81|nr:hypothetical protein IM737_00710 [Devosia sp. SL43]
MMKGRGAEQLRIGYGRIYFLLHRQGFGMNLKKLTRLYSEERLQVRNRGGGKRAQGQYTPDTRVRPAKSALEP